MSDTPWFAMNGVKVPAISVIPTITFDMHTQAERWSLQVDLDRAELGEYRALVQNFCVMDLVFLDQNVQVRRGRAVLASALAMGGGIVRLAWLGRGRLR